MAEDGGSLLSRYNFVDRRITTGYERWVNAMDPASRSMIIKNLSTENFFKSQSQLLHNLSDIKFVKNTFPTIENVYGDSDMDRVHSLWTTKNKFETFLKLKKRDPTFNVDSKVLGVNDNKSKGLALIKPLLDPLEVIKDDDGFMRPTTRKSTIKASLPSNITPVYDPVEFPEEKPYVPSDLSPEDKFNYAFPNPKPLSPSLNLPEVPTHIPRHPTPPPDYEYKEDIAKRKENRNHNRILKKLKTAPIPPSDDPQLSFEDEESSDNDADITMDEAESYVDNSSSNNFVENIEDILKMIEQLTNVVQEKLNKTFKNSLVYTLTLSTLLSE